MFISATKGIQLDTSEIDFIEIQNTDNGVVGTIFKKNSKSKILVTDWQQEDTLEASKLNITLSVKL